MPSRKFLSETFVLRLHQSLIEKFGGASGILSKDLLESALAQPQATFDGKFLHRTIHEQAAAYLYHISMAHAFVDGNKRTAVGVMGAFLQLNGYEVVLSNDQLFIATIGVVDRKLSKEDLSKLIKEGVKLKLLKS